MFENLKPKIKAGSFRQSCICLAIFCLFAGVLSMLTLLEPEVELRCFIEEVSNSHLTAFPGGDVDNEAAVRWNCRQRTNTALRLDNRNNFRAAPPVQNSSAEFRNIPCSEILFANSFLWHNQPLLTYYRRLWQKILPPRAGPCA